MVERVVAGRQGFEPRYRGPEPRVLPLDDLPVPVRLAGADGNSDYRGSRQPPATSCPTAYWDARSVVRFVAIRPVAQHVHADVAPRLDLAGPIRHRFVRHRLRRLLRLRLLLLLAAMARHPALAAGLTCFFARPLVSRAFLMRGLATLARNLALLVSVHRCESTILFGHY